MKTASLTERYRPQTWDQVRGQDKAVKLLQAMLRDGEQCFWLVGQTGTGKTTLAKIAARELAEPGCIVEVDAIDVDAEFLREAERVQHNYGGSFDWNGSSKPGRVWIVNEAHNLSARSVGKLKTLLENLPDHCAWFFTTTNDDQEMLFEGSESAKPMLGRCNQIQLARRDLSRHVADYLQACLADCGLDGTWPRERYERIAKDCGNSFREALLRAAQIARNEAMESAA